MNRRSARWPVKLTDQDLTLRPLRRRDEPAWADIRRRGAAWFGPWDASRPEASTEPTMSWSELVTEFNRRARQGRMLPWGLHYRPEPSARPVFAGQVTISQITWGSACWGQVGYWIDPRWAGRGLVPRGVALGVDYAFSIGLHRIEVAIRRENHNSLAVVRKLGFRYEGRRPNYMHVAGAWRDHDLFALHSEEVPGGLLARLKASADDSPTLRPA